MFKKTHVFAGCIVVIIACLLVITSLSAVVFKPISLAETKCVPVKYPEGEFIELESHKINLYHTSESVDQVASFYQGFFSLAMPGESSQFSSGQWFYQSKEKYGAHFRCSNALSRLDSETGCIFLHETKEGTAIELTWLMGEVAPGCSSTYSK